MFQNGSSDNEKAYAINTVLNEMFFERVKRSYKNDYEFRDKGYSHLYKFRALFRGDLNTQLCSFSEAHSMLANLVLDFKKVENEDEIITYLRECYHKIIDFSKDENSEKLMIKGCDIIYRVSFKEMLKHILISDKNLPSNINVNSLARITDDYIIFKK